MPLRERDSIRISPSRGRIPSAPGRNYAAPGWYRAIFLLFIPELFSMCFFAASAIDRGESHIYNTAKAMIKASSRITAVYREPRDS